MVTLRFVAVGERIRLASYDHSLMSDTGVHYLIPGRRELPSYGDTHIRRTVRVTVRLKASQTDKTSSDKY